MATFVRDGIEFTIPDGIYTGKELREHVGTDLPVPVVSKQNGDYVVTPEESIELGPLDRVSFVGPMESASCRS